VVELHAICWQDTAEPWGWAPATPEVIEWMGIAVDVTAEIATKALASGPFFWDREEAETAYEKLVEIAAEVWLPIHRDHDRVRIAKETQRFEEQKAGKIPGVTTPGVAVMVEGRPQVAVPEPPGPAKTDEELRGQAVAQARQEWRIQTYEVPDRG
jgi:hypothetical protein